MFISVKKLNVTKDAIGRQEDVDEFAYLQSAQLPRTIDPGDVSRLTGVDVPEVPKPVEICKSRN